MSTYEAIGVVTERLVQMLKDSVGVNVTALPVSQSDGSPLNVFLYQTTTNPSWRNQDLPRPAGRGQPQRPLLALNLYYLLSAGNPANDSSVQTGHRNLAKAMLTLHDRPELKLESSKVIKNQPDPIRITPHPVSVDEMSKLWSAFQHPYRLSAAYEVGTVLIESERPQSSPLPVLKRGDDDRGWDSTTIFPGVLTDVRYATAFQAGARFGDRVTIIGRRLLQSKNSRIRLTHATVKEKAKDLTKDLPESSIVSRTDTAFVCTLPSNAENWPAGISLLRVSAPLGSLSKEHTQESNAVPVAMLPHIDLSQVLDKQLRAKAAGEDALSLELPVQPKIHTGQSVQVVIGRFTIDNPKVDDKFRVTAVWSKEAQAFKDLKDSADRVARVRVDGVDSLIVDPKDPSGGVIEGLKVEMPQ